MQPPCFPGLILCVYNNSVRFLKRLMLSPHPEGITLSEAIEEEAVMGSPSGRHWTRLRPPTPSMMDNHEEEEEEEEGGLTPTRSKSKVSH